MAGAAWFIGSMTRKEALERVAATFPIPVSYTIEMGHAEHIISALEAIGLVKFDEPPLSPPLLHIKDSRTDNTIVVPLEDAVLAMCNVGFVLTHPEPTK